MDTMRWLLLSANYYSTTEKTYVLSPFKNTGTKWGQTSEAKLEIV